MFVSFFPNPRPFFLSALVWTIVVVAGWYLGGEALGGLVGLPPAAPDAAPIIGAERFVSGPFLWFYLYFAVATLLFYGFWKIAAPHPWAEWSILGTALILFTTYFQVQVSVALNDWYGPFGDLIQAAVSKSRPVTLSEIHLTFLSFAEIASFSIVVGVLTYFFVNHYVFRWRTAMNDYYMSHWGIIRKIEGASQRVQDDTMRFSRTMETLGVEFVGSVMTLIAFTPVLIRLSTHVTELPIVGSIPQPLLTVAILWAAFGTGFLALVGIKLPGLQFKNQRVEAAYRKELVYGEDDTNRAQPSAVQSLFAHVRRNYFRIFFHYTYFNVARLLYRQTDSIFPYLILGPSLVAGSITLGLLNQVLNAFGEVRSSFQFLVNSWTIIIDLLSIHKRLRGLDAVIRGEPLPEIDQSYLERQEEIEPA